MIRRMIRKKPSQRSSASKRRRVRVQEAHRIRDSRRRGGRIGPAPLIVLLAAIPVLLAPGPVHRADAYRFFPMEGAGYV
jgi:hypothetical protein